MLLCFPVSITPGFSRSLNVLVCLIFSVASYEALKGTVLHMEFAGARRVRQGCPASGFLFAMDFDRIFRWLQEPVVPRNVYNLEFLQPTQCAYAYDLAIASSSFRELMVVLAPVFRSIDYVAGPNLMFRKCCWVQYGNGEFASLRTWVSETCEEFRHMQNVRHAKYVGTMIGPHGHLNRWTAARKNQPTRDDNNASSNSLVERLFHLKIYAISVLSFIGSVCASDKATLQCTTARPYNAFHSSLLQVGSICGGWS